MGSPMFQNSLKVPQPSIRAAFSRSSWTAPWKNCVIQKMPKAGIMLGMISAFRVETQPSLLIIIN